MNPTISNTLFHFTGIDYDRGIFKPKEESLNTLKSILESQHFLLSRNQREWTIFDVEEPVRHMNFDLPMLCFTETPIEYIGMHMNVFGHFGVGMKIDWAIKNHAQNVIYCDKSEPNYYGRILAGVLDFCHNNLATDPNTQAKWYWFRSLVGVTEDIIFRNEREWRFIGRTENKPGGGESFTPEHIDFDVNDIEAIVCPKACILEVHDFLKRLPNYSQYAFKVLSSEELLMNEEGG
ncbi:abortive infection system antitoxin AbiGi family protein [Desulfobacter curvatus]|uniref:abortive infection system antitoxin AbiGi family protein n=1 Tax=Desulfobacter curvatus TaxID=2290 RepID=UPI0012FAEBE0|nr:abortive infection system antitoxin AbiGi family protein [Desulfobacter curvatus]